MPCDTPFYVMPKGGLEKVPVPCGRCPPCKIRRVNGWVFRLLQEEKRSESAHFLTLTYDTNSVPITQNGFMTLHKPDLQKFFKRLRKLNGTGIKYYAVGEYGTNNKRPHYHAIVFNADPSTYARAWSLDDVPIGYVHVGTVSGDSIAYTLKYIDKPVFGPMHSRDDRQREFPVMSKHLGDNYLSPDILSYHKSDAARMFLTQPGGHVIAMPRYYRTKIYDETELNVQKYLSKQAVQSLDDACRKQFALLGYKDYTYEQYLSSLRFGRHTHFYNSLNKRDKILE
ncbi:MAG: replication initiator protein [Microvirus sp.]|nr:MAG: replication initiator protein [Microvirus sp.]